MCLRTEVAAIPVWVMCFSSKCITEREHTHGKYAGPLVIASLLPKKV